MVFSFLLVLSIATALIMEQYRAPLDENTNATSSKVVVDSEDGEWAYESAFKTGKEAYEGFKNFAIKEAQETFVLLKNNNNSLPLKQSKPKVTLFGVRSYAPLYGSNGGSIADKYTVENGNTITDAFKKTFDMNPSMLATYETLFKDLKWGGSGFGAVPPEYPDVTKYTDPCEFTPDELKKAKADYDKDYASYNDAAIVILGRPGGEGHSYYPGEVGRTTVVKDSNGNETGKTVVNTDTGNILGISDEEKQIIEEAKKCSDNVVVLINSTNQMEIEALKDDEDIDSVMWIGFPGAYGFEALAQVLTGKANPSGRLGDTYAVNTALAPAMMNYGGDENGTQIAWKDKADYTGNENVNSYLVQAEGIYTGYRYYETRYADTLTDSGNAKTAAAGTYVTSATNYKPASAEGEWVYGNEVSYPFGYGLSYTTFEQTLAGVEVSSDHKTAVATVKVENTGDVAGADVVQLYAQVPYIEDGVEKSAIQLVDYEKTPVLQPDSDAVEIKLNIDMANIASYDYEGDKTYILDQGTYYFAIGSDSHDALNNILAQKGVSGMVNTDGTKFVETSGKVDTWELSSKDSKTFATSDNGTKIENRLTDGMYAMDLNAFKSDVEGLSGGVVYLSRSDWNGTFPKTYANLSVKNGTTTEKLLKNDFIALKTDEDTSDIVFGDSSVGLTFNDMKDAAFNDERWDELISKIPVSEVLDFMANAFHNIQAIPSIGFNGYAADDGPGGSDTHTLGEGAYRGTPYADAKDYEGYGTRVAPAPTNLAYAWNKELAYENGEIILGETTLVLNLPIVIGPGMNLHRHAYNGRGCEYYSEDPILSGFTGSAVVQGAQSKGCLVNIKHAAFNDQEANRSGVAVFMNEQKARELELRNLQQAFTAKGRSSSSEAAAGKTANSYAAEGALGVMTSYNRIGFTAPSANKAVMVNIMREEWGFKGYSVTDFTGVNLKAAPKESIMFGTTAFCGMGKPSVSYWNEAALRGDKTMMQALHDSMHYALYALSRSYAMDLNTNTHVVSLMTWYRATYTALITVSAVLAVAAVAGYAVFSVKGKKENESEEV